MPSEYRFRIGADDDASRIFSKIAGAAKRSMGDVEDSLDDGRSAAKKLADAISEMADELDQSVQDSQRAADRIGQALGDDLRAKVGDAGIDKFVADLQRAGLTADEIATDADELAAALKRLDDVSVNAGRGVSQSFDDVDGAVRRTSDSVDKSRSVMANFAGNAVQDIPGIAGSFGALNVAAGQFAEYASEGDVSLKNFAKSLGPIAIGTVVIGAIANKMQQVAKIKAFDDEQVEEWAKAIREGSTALEAMIDAAKESGELELSITVPVEGLDSDLNATRTSVEDLTGDLATLGVTVEQFGRLTQGSQEQLDAWASSQRASGADADALTNVLAGVTAAKDQMAAATENAANIESVYGESAEAAAAALADLNEKLDANRQRNDEAREAQERNRLETLAAIDANLGLSAAKRSTSEAIQDYLNAADDEETWVDEVAEAQDRAAEAALGQAAATVQLWEDTAAANGEMITAAERQAIYRGELESIAGQLAPDSPLRRQLQGYIEQLISVPPTVSTTFEQTYIVGDGDPTTRDVQRRAKGGPVAAGKPYIVGEDGPELMVPGSSGRVVPNDALGSVTINQNFTYEPDEWTKHKSRRDIEDVLRDLGWRVAN